VTDRINLRLYKEPGAAEIFVNLKRQDGGYELMVAVIDTGAEYSLLPTDLLQILEYEQADRGAFRIEQAGMARQVFEATEATVTVYLEDVAGSRTPEFGARFWFADTRARLVGFKDILDRAALHIDMLKMEGWLEM
jgi:hypothetical protein